MDPDEIQMQKELLTNAYAQSQAYTNLLIGAGYAGCFAIWALMKDRLTSLTAFSVALLICCSVTVFVLWEVYGMFYRSRLLLGISRAVQSPSNFSELMEQARNLERSHSLVYGKAWYVVLFITISTGIAAVIVLLSSFLHGLWLHL